MFRQFTKVVSHQHRFNQQLKSKLFRGTGSVWNTQATRHFSSQSQVTQDYAMARKKITLATEEGHGSSHYVSKLPDYELSESDLIQTKKFELTGEEVRAKHPSEYFVKDLRKKADIYQQIKPNQLLLVNLPDSITKTQISELCTVKGTQLLDVTIKKALDQRKTAFATVEFGTPKEAKQMRSKLENQWIQDKQIKVRTQADLLYEDFGNRTVLVQGIPQTFKEEDLIEIFGNQGAVVGIELPTYDLQIEQELLERASDPYTNEKKAKNEQKFRRAQKTVADALNADQQYMQLLESFLGKDEARTALEEASKVSPQVTQMEVLDQQRYKSLSRVMTTLQSEGKEVSSAKHAFISLRQSLEKGSEVPSLGQSSNQEDYTSQIELQREKISRVFKYLDKNREALDESTLSSLNLLSRTDQELPSQDPLERLMKLSQGELTLAYDALIEALREREKLIKQRIQQQTKHLGKEERILMQGKDFSRELEDIQDIDDVFNSKMKVEEYLSVNEQIQNVHDAKNVTPQEKLYDLVTKQFNPFAEANFNQDQLNAAQNPELSLLRNMPIADRTLPQSFARLIHHSKPFKPLAMQQVMELVDDIRDQMDLPFDELYHKEKNLVQQVIEAEKALKAKEATLPNPFGEDRVFDPKTIDTGLLAENYSHDHQFIRDQRAKNEKLMSQDLQSDANFGVDTKFQIKMKSMEEEMLDSGMLSEKDHDRMKELVKEQRLVNLGYAFVTYSHSDEARLALMVSQHLFVDAMRVEVSLKANIDHKDLDFKYKINKQRNESKITEELQKLRESRKDLRDFEENLDNELPSLKKLKQFREVARDVIEGKDQGNDYKLREHQSTKRTSAEEQALNEKIRQLQKENPDVDYTQLFASEKAEQARKNQHKKSLSTYKAYQFLKHGVDPKNKPTETVQQRQKTNPLDPYEFPALNETVSQLLTKDKFPRVLDGGDSLDKPGRKFAYSERDFIEAYFGKDYARSPNLDTEQNAVFGYNEQLKYKYPIDKYKMAPMLKAKKQKLEEALDIQELNDPLSKSDFTKFIDNKDMAETHTAEDTPHPSDPSRSLIKDAENMVGSLIQKRERAGHKSFYTRDVAMIKKQLRDEYFPKPEKKRFTKTENAVQEETPDTKQTEKFEPFYEGESQTAPQQDSQATVTMEENPSPQPPQRKKRHDKRSSAQGSKPPTQKVQMSFDLAQTQEVMQLNREELYDYKFNKQKNHEYRPDELWLKKLEKTANISKTTPEQLMDELKDTSNITGENGFGGEFYQQNKLGLLEKSISSREKQSSNLSSYAKETESEREDEDIYGHYMRKMQEHKAAKVDTQKLTLQEREAKLKLQNLEDLMPDVPNFEGFFKSQSQGKSVFEDEKYKVDEEQAKKDREEEEKYDEELLERELKGRMIGETLTPRQFGMLYKAKLDEGSYIKFIKNKDRQQFIESRDEIRILEELKESLRRRKVISGEWTEEESHSKLINQLKAEEESLPSKHEMHQIRRHFDEFKEMLLNMQHPDKLFEKEYYFDEGLGESINDHISNLKTEYPDLQVQVRRDRDGFAIVKTQLVPKYKYDLEALSKFDPKGQIENVKVSLESLLKAVLPEGGVQSIHNLDKHKIEQALIMMQNNESKSQYDLDLKSKDALNVLIKERLQGKFQNDADGFTQAFLNLAENVNYDKNKQAPQQPFFDLNDSVDSERVFDELYEDRSQIASELFQQLTSRVKAHLFMKERKPTDLVKGKRSEVNVFNNQLNHFDKGASMLERDNRDVLEAGDNNQVDEAFDKVAYQELKKEIKRRREAKEQLLQQGFPDFKPYVNL